MIAISMHSMLDEFQVIEDTKRARAEGATWIMVSLHRGVEYTAFPSPDTWHFAQLLAQSCLDACLSQ